jgi:hypothetical protein
MVLLCHGRGIATIRAGCSIAEYLDQSRGSNRVLVAAATPSGGWIPDL